MTAQHIINSLDFARKALEIHDTIAVLNFSRLADVLRATDTTVDFRLSGAVGQDGKARLFLQVQAKLSLICQRCLEGLDFNLHTNTEFVVVADESAIPSEDEESDDYDYLLADPAMHVLQLVEDEILLALPLAPAHAAGNCELAYRDDSNKKTNPFAVLQSLKKN